MSMLVRHVSESVPAPATIDPSIDPQLGEWIMRLLQKDPQARPKDAQEAWDRLEEIVIHLVGPRWRREARLPDGAQHAEDGREAAHAGAVLRGARPDHDAGAAVRHLHARG